MGAIDYERAFRDLYLIRHLEEELARIYPTDKIQSPMHLSIGQELASVAVCHQLEAGEKVFGTYRGHALYLARGGDVNAFVAELYGKRSGCTKGKGGSMHLADPVAGLVACSAIVGSTIPLAVGWALAEKLAGRKTCTVAFFGDGATEEGAFYESLNFARLHKLPVLFVCENNYYAIHSPLKQRQGTPIGYRTAGLVSDDWVEAEDGNDLEAMFGTAELLVKVVREEQAPRFLEVRAQRWRGHVGPEEDFDAGYRDRVDVVGKLDPVETAMRRLGNDAAMVVMDEVDAQVAAAIRFAEESPEPTEKDLLEDVYGG